MPVPAAVGSKPSSRPRRSSLEGTWSSTWAFTAADDDADVVIEGILIQAAVRPAHLASLGDDRDVPRDGARGDKPRKRRSLYNARHNKAIMEGAAAAVEAGAETEVEAGAAEAEVEAETEVEAGAAEAEVEAETEAEVGTAAEAGVVKAAPAHLASEEALRQAQAEGLTLRVGKNSTGYFGVCHEPTKSLPYRAQLKCEGKKVTLGNFATAEEAALCVARSPQGQRAAKAAEVAAAVPPPLTSEEAVRQAQEEGLPLLKAFPNRPSTTGYYGVQIDVRSQIRPYAAQVWRDGKSQTLNRFATAEEAALCVARSPEGQAAAKRAAPVLLLQLVPAEADAAPATVLAADDAAAAEAAAAVEAAAAAAVAAKKKKAVTEQASGRTRKRKTLAHALVPLIAPPSVLRPSVRQLEPHQLEQHADEQDPEEESGDAGGSSEGGEEMHEAQEAHTAQVDDSWCVGSRLEALDKVDIWCRASVLATKGEGPSRMVKVHYVGWNKRLDEWLSVSGGRLRQEENAQELEEPSTKRRKGKQTAAASEGAEEVSGGRICREEGEEQGLRSTPLWEGAAASEEVDEEEGLGGRLCQQSLRDADEIERRLHLRDCTEHLRRCAEHLRGCMEAVDAVHAEDAATEGEASESKVSESEVTEDDQDEDQPAGSCLAAWRELGWEAHTSMELGKGQYWFNWVTGERWWQRPVTAVTVLMHGRAAMAIGREAPLYH